MKRILFAGVFLLAVFAASTALAASSPSVSTGVASAVAENSVTVSGTINPGGTDTQYKFQYGPTTSYGLQSGLVDAGSGSSATAVTANLTNLAAGTTYHFRVVATNANGTTSGQDATFITTGTAPASSPFVPVVTTAGASTITVDGATVSGTVNPQGQPTTYWFQFGTTTSYGAQTTPTSAGSGAAASLVTAALTGLASGQTYHYRLVARNMYGTTDGPDAILPTATPAATPSALSVFGTTGFVAPSGVAGVFTGCLHGGTGCTGTMTVSRSGTSLGTRSSFVIAANGGVVVHLTLNALGRQLIKQRKTLRVNLTISSTGAATYKTIVTLKQFGG